MGANYQPTYQIKITIIIIIFAERGEVIFPRKKWNRGQKSMRGRKTGKVHVKRMQGSFRSDERLTLVTWASLSVHGGNLTHPNLFDIKF